MWKTRGIVGVLASVAFVAFFSLQVAAQAPTEQAPAASAAQAGEKPETLKGTLKSVNSEKMTLTLTSGETFQYTAQTKVTGAQGGVEGLGSVSGRQVTIQYTTKGAARIATSIEVAAADAK